ncbi:hypothetical protein CRM22_000708 [Opisthorchis felineus]|uniref:Uncharacterized protein n=1 Tax=Opisthorchis felineus TaxID=147828 RepID=A0A4S2ME38_OPIFE|nr:hypothetical protein CRM22_000708 [Opisthorchis felineus]
MTPLVLTVLGYASVFSVVELGTLISCGILSALIRYMIIPNVVWQQSLDFTFNTTCPVGAQTLNNMCGFPTAEFPLSFDGEPVLTMGQEYAISAHLHFPDSDNNRLSGLFPVLNCP